MLLNEIFGFRKKATDPVKTIIQLVKKDRPRGQELGNQRINMMIHVFRGNKELVDSLHDYRLRFNQRFVVGNLEGAIEAFTKAVDLYKNEIKRTNDIAAAKHKAAYNNDDYAVYPPYE